MKKSKIGKTLPAAGLREGEPQDRAQDQHHGDVDELGAIGGTAPVLNLANHFLIAMPSMQDPVFGGTVVYVLSLIHI